MTPWTVACQAPLSMGFSRQEYWSGLPCPPPGDLPNLEIEPRPSILPLDFLPSESPGKSRDRLDFANNSICTSLRLYWLSGKESEWQCGGYGFNPRVRKITWRRKLQPTPVFLPGKSHGQRRLAGYIPWGRKELEMTEGLSSQDSTDPCSERYLQGYEALSYLPSCWTPLWLTPYTCKEV